MSENRVRIEIMVEGRDAERAVKDLTYKLKDLTTETDRSGQGMRRMKREADGLKSTIRNLAAAFAGFQMAQFTKDTAMAAARYETLGVVMIRVGKNAGYTKQQMYSLEHQLRKTGISMTEARSTLTRMVQAQLDLAKATKLARVAQDAAVIGNINSSEAFQRLIYGIQSAQVEVLRTIGINVNFNNSYQKTAKQLGITTTQLTEAQKAHIRMNTVLEAGVQIAGSYQDAMDTAGKKITSFTRYVDDFKVEMGKAFGPSLGTIVDEATQAMKEFTKEIQREENQKMLAQLGEDAVLLGGYLKSIGTVGVQSLAMILRGWNALPEVVKDIGIIGAIVGGAKARAAIVLIAAAVGQIERLNAQAQGVGEADKLTAQMNMDMNRLATLRSQYKSLTPTEKAGAFGDRYRRDISMLETSITDYHTRIQHVQMQAFKEAESKIPTGRAVPAAPTLPESPDVFDGIKGRDKAAEKALKDSRKKRLAQVKSDEKARQKMINDFNKKRIALVREASGMEKQINFAKTRAIYKAAKKDVADRTKLEEMYAREVGKLNKSHFEEKVKYATSFSEFFKYKVALETGVYETELEKRQREWEIFYDGLYEIATGAGRAMRSALSDVLFDAMSGEMKSFKDYWDAFWDSMKRSVANAVADMAVTWAMSQMSKWGSSFLSGLSIFHTGTQAVGEDEVIAKLQVGEMIIPAKQAAAIRESMADGGMSKDDYFNRVVSHVQYGNASPYDFNEVQENYVDAQMLGKFKGAAMGAGIAGVANAVSSYSSTMSMAKLLSNSVDVDMGEARGLAMKNAQMGFMRVAFPNLVSSFAGGLMNTALGLDNLGISPNLNRFFGFDIDSGAQEVLSAGLGFMLGLPTGAGAVFSPVVGMAMSGIADAFDVRSDETLRDAMEDRFGFIGGRTVYDAVSTWGQNSPIQITQSFSDPGKYAYLGWNDSDNTFFTGTAGVEELIDKIEGIMNDPAMRAARFDEKVRLMSRNFGSSYTKAALNSGDTKTQEAIAKAIAGDIDFYGFQARERAAQILGEPLVSQDYAYMPDGSRISREAFDFQQERTLNPITWSLWGGKDAPGDNAGGTVGNGLGGDHGWGGNDHHGGNRGDSAYAHTGGYLAKSLKPDEGNIIVQTGEAVVSRPGMEILDKINKGEAPGMGSGDTHLTVQIVANDGRILEEHVIHSLKNASENGVAVVHSDGVYTEVGA